jgi:DNA-binding Lrp family transcriptional regulator
MPTAFVFVNTETGLESDVLRELKALESVKEALLVYGLYDIILLVEYTSLHNLKQFVTWKIRKMDKIKDTQTIVPV